MSTLRPPVCELGTEYRFTRLFAWLERFRNPSETARFTSFDSTIILIGVILLYLVITFNAASRQLWHDELFTYYIAKSPSIAKMWEGAFFLAMHTNTSRLAAAVASCVLLLGIGALNLGPALDVFRALRAAPHPSIQVAIQQVRPDLPLVAASGLTFLEMDKYAKPNTVSRLFYLTDLDFAIRYAHSTIFERYAVLKEHFPIRANVEPYRKFVGEHPEFLVLGSPDIRRTGCSAMCSIHATVQFLGDFPGPYKDTQLYDVKIPSGAQ